MAAYGPARTRERSTTRVLERAAVGLFIILGTRIHLLKLRLAVKSVSNHLNKSIFASQVTADYQFLYLAGSFVDGGGQGIAQVTFDGMFVGVADGAM